MFMVILFNLVGIKNINSYYITRHSSTEIARKSVLAFTKQPTSTEASVMA